MKIAVFHNLPPGGAKRTLYEQMKYLSTKHHLDSYEYSSTDESLWDVTKLTKNIFRYEFDLKRKDKSFLGRLVKDYRNFISLDTLNNQIALDIKKRNYDVVLVHADRFTQAPFILKHLAIPSLYFCQEYLRLAYEEQLKFTENVILAKKLYENITRKIRKEIDKKNACSATKVFANSKFTKKNIDKAFGINSILCHLGVDASVFQKSAKNRDNYLLYIGEKNKTAGLSLVLDAIKLFPQKLRPRIKRLGFSQGKLKVVDDRVLAKEYSAALATICTSFNEPFGLASIESMACETPVLAVNEGGYQETVVNNKTGFLLPRSPKEFAEKINFLIENPQLSNKMGQAGRKHVIDNFSWEKHVNKVEKALKSLTL